MKQFILILLTLLFCNTIYAQKAKYDLRIVEKSASCDTKKAVFQIEIKAATADSTFKMGDANFRFSYPNAVLANPVLLTQDNFSSDAGDFNYDVMTMLNQNGTTNNTLTLNVVYLGLAKGAKTVDVNWIPVASFEFSIVALSNPCYLLKWYKNTDFPSSGLNEIVITQTSPFQYNTTPAKPNSFTDLNSCLNLPVPTASISGSATIISGASTNLSVALTGASPWSVKLSDGTTQTASASPLVIPVSPTATTTYTVSEVSNVCGTSTNNTGSATVVVNNADPCANAVMPTASISGTTSITAGQSAQLSVALGGSTGPWNVKISDGTTQVASTSPLVFSVSPATTTTYTVISVADACKTNTNTTGSATVTVTPIDPCGNKPSPTASISGTVTITKGQSTPLNISLGGSTEPWIIHLSDGTTHTSTTPNLTVNVSPIVTTTYTITSVADACKTNTNTTGSAVVTVNPINPCTNAPMPTATFEQVSNEIGFGKYSELKLNLTGTPGWTFKVFDGENYSATFQTLSSPYYIYVGPKKNTTYSITAISDTCRSNVPVNTSTTVILTCKDAVLPTAQISLSGWYSRSDTTIVKGSSVVYYLTLSSPLDIITVKLSDGSTHVIDKRISNYKIITLTPTSSTKISIVSVSDSCSVNTGISESININVSDCLNSVLPTASISGTTAITAGQSANLSVLLGGSEGPWTVKLSNGSTYTSSTSPLLISVSPNATTTYTVTSVADACKTNTNNTGSATVTVNDPCPNSVMPTASISGTATISAGQKTTLRIALGGSNGPWTVKLSNGDIFSNDIPEILIDVSPTVTTTYTVTSVSDACKTNTNTSGAAIITVNPNGGICNEKCIPMTAVVIRK